MSRWLRLSLFARAAASLGILGVTAVGVAVLAGVLGGLFLLVVAALLVRLGGLPSVSSVAPVPAWAAALAAFAAFAAVVLYPDRDDSPDAGGSDDAYYADQPSTDYRKWAQRGLLAVLAYVLIVETAQALAGLLLAHPLAAVVVAVVLMLWTTVDGAREQAAALRERLLEDSAPASETHPDLVGQVRRLASLASVPAPEVYVTDRSRPEAYTVGHGADAALVVSTGLVEALDGDELEAVLAHEVSHLANGDSRVMGAALGPVLAADEWIEEDPEEGDEFWNRLFGALKWVGQAGVAVLSVGRERAADRGAASLTGAPEALASALAELDGRRRPETDLREWEQQAAALDVLPPADRGTATGPFSTHPPTEERIERLRRLAEDSP